MADIGIHFEVPVENPVVAEPKHDYSNVNWSNCLKWLFSEEKDDMFALDWGNCLKCLFFEEDDLIDVDWAHCLKWLFAEHKKDFSNEDWAIPFARLYFELKPAFVLDLEAIAAGPAMFGNNILEEQYDDEQLECDEIASSSVRPCKGAKKSLLLKSNNSHKFTRRQKQAFPLHRAEKQRQQILRGGVFESLAITHGTSGPFGFEQ